MTARKPLFVTWCPKDALDGMNSLGPWEELAYRRTIDLIYASNNELADDDKKMGWMTKVGTRRWKRIKSALTTGPDPKLYIEDGKIRNRRCDEEVKKICAYRDAQSARAKSRKPLDDYDTSTADATAGAPPPHPPTVIRYPLVTDNAAKVPPEISFSAVIFNQCVPYLESKGLSKDRAKSIIGGWRKQKYADAAIIDAVGKAQRAQPPVAEPVSYITAILKQFSTRQVNTCGV